MNDLSYRAWPKGLGVAGLDKTIKISVIALAVRKKLLKN
jgi:hypothetical protein